MVVRRVKNFAYSFRHGFGFYALDVFPSRKEVHIESHRSARRPKTKSVDGVAAVSAYVHIVRNGYYRSRVLLFHFKFSVHPVFFQRSAELNFEGVFFSRIKPYVAVVQPVVGKFHLPAVHYSLLENTVVVSYRKTARRVSACGKAVHIRRGKTTQTAVS